MAPVVLPPTGPVWVVPLASPVTATSGWSTTPKPTSPSQKTDHEKPTAPPTGEDSA